MGRNKKKQGGIVYSTDPDFNPSPFEALQDLNDSQGSQNLRVWRQRIKGNKTVTQVRGFTMPDSEIKALAKELKNLCGAGGNSKDKEIIIQGDHADKICAYLNEKGYKARRAGG